jgi:hypothetical protein
MCTNPNYLGPFRNRFPLTFVPETSIGQFFIIKPILLYGCEIWGTFNTFSAEFRHGMQNLYFDQIYCEQKAELLFDIDSLYAACKRENISSIFLSLS